jgi:predicted amidophosphoribosyltransferase
MLCEQCGKELETTTCGQCGRVVLKLGSFCYSCGNELGRVEPTGGETEAEGIDLSSRVLCSDGTCIGVIDEKGICKVCGKPYSPEA